MESSEDDESNTLAREILQCLALEQIGLDKIKNVLAIHPANNWKLMNEIVNLIEEDWTIDGELETIALLVRLFVESGMDASDIYYLLRNDKYDQDEEDKQLHISVLVQFSIFNDFDVEEFIYGSLLSEDVVMNVNNFIELMKVLDTLLEEGLSLEEDVILEYIDTYDSLVERACKFHFSSEVEKLLQCHANIKEESQSNLIAYLLTEEEENGMDESEDASNVIAIIKLLKAYDLDVVRFILGDSSNFWHACSRIKNWKNTGLDYVLLDEIFNCSKVGMETSNQQEQGGELRSLRQDMIKYVSKNAYQYNVTPIVAALRKRNMHIVRAILNCTSSAIVREVVSTRCGHGFTVLHYAAADGDSDTINTLIQCGMLVDIKDDAGRTPLFSACSSRNADTVEALVAAGADVNMLDNEGNIVWSLIDNRSKRIVNCLRNAQEKSQSDEDNDDHPISKQSKIT